MTVNEHEMMSSDNHHCATQVTQKQLNK